MSDVKDISAEEFDRELKGSESPVVLEFWVRSCDQCRKFKSVYESLPEVFGGKVRFLRMNMLKTIENLRLSKTWVWSKHPRRRYIAPAARWGR